RGFARCRVSPPRSKPAPGTSARLHSPPVSRSFSARANPLGAPGRRTRTAARFPSIPQRSSRGSARASGFRALEFSNRKNDTRMAMPKQQIASEKLRTPMGQFSHATAIEARGRMLFISGMTARRADGSIAGIGDIEAQTRQVCENLKAAAEAAGGSLADICRVDVYVRNIENFEIIHKVRREYFKPPLPASTMVEIAK